MNTYKKAWVDGGWLCWLCHLFLACPGLEESGNNMDYVLHVGVTCMSRAEKAKREVRITDVGRLNRVEDQRREKAKES